MDAKERAKQMFKALDIPASKKITEEVIEEALIDYTPAQIGMNFSKLIGQLQVDAYHRYLEYEAERGPREIVELLLGRQHDRVGGDNLEQVLRKNFMVLDRFFLSLTNSRRNRAGAAFQVVVQTLLEKLGYPHTPQPVLDRSQPDFVFPSESHYYADPLDCLIFTVKRSLRERWKQILNEGTKGTLFFLATIDKGISDAQLRSMHERKVYVVVPKLLCEDRYPRKRNVIPFEAFFTRYLDPAMQRWKETGVIEKVGSSWKYVDEEDDE